MMLVCMIKTFNEDHTAGCEGVVLQLSSNILPMNCSPWVKVSRLTILTVDDLSVPNSLQTAHQILLTTPSSLCSFPNSISSSSHFRTVFNDTVCGTPEAFAFLGIGSLLCPLLLLVAAKKIRNV